MPPSEEKSAAVPQQVNDLFDSLEVNKTIGNEEFKVFLSRIPIAIIISKFVHGDQRVVFANKAYEDLTGQLFPEIRGQGWSVLDSFRLEDEPHLEFSRALPKSEDFVGCFRRDSPKPILVEAYAGLIENEDGTENYRIVALIDVTERQKAQREAFARQIRDKDTLLKEIQHRVKNNLQLVTALIRLDARIQRRGGEVNLDRLAGRIESLQILYRDLSADGFGQTVDLGHYLSQIASALMHTYAVDGIRLDLKVDHALVSINVAMPVGLLVNELMTNSFKYAFNGRGGGVLTLRCLHSQDNTYRVVVSDDGVGFPEGTTWPLPGKMQSLILQTLKENVKADFNVESAPGKGTCVTIGFVHTPPSHKPN